MAKSLVMTLADANDSQAWARRFSVPMSGRIVKKGLGRYGEVVGGSGINLSIQIFLLRWSRRLPFLTRLRGGSYVRGEKTGYGHPGQTKVCPHTAAITHLRTADKLARLCGYRLCMTISCQVLTPDH
ncbi:hypothetical protein EMIT0P44_80216 [Pseudomonas sp. IT-P44]